MGGLLPPKSKLWCDLFSWFQWPEVCTCVDVDDGLVKNMHFHIKPSISVNVSECDGDWRKVLTIANDGWELVDFGLCTITAWTLNHENVAVKVHGDKV